MSHRIRIVSDIHLGHRASVVESTDALSPLAEGVDHLIFNGDTLELKYGDLENTAYDATAQKQRFDEVAAKWGCQITLITGNHDPAISDTHYLSLCGGEVFVTHGDGLFPEIAPWSSSVELLRKCGSGIDPDATGNSHEELHAYLQLHKRASIEAHKLDDDYNPTLWGKLKIFLHQTWPPTTPFKILNCWRIMPDKAVSLATRFGHSPSFLIIGHTHNPGVWKRGKHTIINLGSLFQWPGAQCVDIEGDQLLVRKLHKRHHSLRIGKVFKRFAIPQHVLASNEAKR